MSFYMGTSTLGWLKCNFDYSYNREGVDTGVGWIIRDHSGKMVTSGGARLTGITSSLEGEAQAFLYAVQQVWIQGWRNVWFEGDNQNLVDIVNGYHESLELGNLIYDIRHWIELLPEHSLAHVNREKNQAADCIVKKMRMENDLSVVFKLPPSWLIDFLYYPIHYLVERNSCCYKKIDTS